MKYYSYSVKDILTEYFGADPLAVMRKKSQTSLGPEHSKHLIPLSWQYADEQIMHLFLDHKFLIRTVIEDDYIAYIYQEGSQQCALLLFITDEDKGPFSRPVVMHTVGSKRHLYSRISFEAETAIIFL